MKINNAMRNNNRNIWSRRLAFQAIYSWSINECEIDELQSIFREDENYSKPDGISLLPLVNNELIPENYAFTETGNPLYEKSPPKEPSVKSIRSSKWKLIFNEYDNSKELYNLELDPDEKNNLINTGESMEESLWNELTALINKHD